MDSREYTVNVWNTYSVKPESCKLVIRRIYTANSVAEAIEEARAEAIAWNMQTPALDANVLTCEGHVSLVL